MKKYSILLFTLMCFLSACSEQNSNYTDQSEYDRQIQEYSVQLEKMNQQQAEADKQLKISREQQERMNKILDRWENQADRYDAILKKWEQQEK